MVLDKNPAGQIPVLELADGTCIPESTAILFFVAEGTHLLPADPLERTRVLSWLCFEQTNVDRVISRARFRRKYPEVIPTRPEEFDAWLRDGTRTLKVLDEHLRTRRFMVGDSLSIADLALTPTCTGRTREGSTCRPCSGFAAGSSASKNAHDTSASTPYHRLPRRRRGDSSVTVRASRSSSTSFEASPCLESLPQIGRRSSAPDAG